MRKPGSHWVSAWTSSWATTLNQSYQGVTMRALVRTTILLTLLCPINPAFPQPNFDSVDIETAQVRGPIYFLHAGPRIGNIAASVGSDGILLVDDQFAPLAEKIESAFSTIASGKLKFIINTHWHGDHTGGNQIFGFETPIIAHTNVRKRLMTQQIIGNRAVSAAPRQSWPVITFDNSVSVHFNEEEIQIIHFAHGHTDGDSVIFFTRSNVVHTGDLFFVGRFPFIDLDSGGSIHGFINNVAEIIARVDENVAIIPGHGPLASLDDLRTSHRMLEETTAFVSRSISEGKTLEEIKQIGVQDEWASWGHAFISSERWMGLLHRSLTSYRKDASPTQ